MNFRAYLHRIITHGFTRSLLVLLLFQQTGSTAAEPANQTDVKELAVKAETALAAQNYQAAIEYALPLLSKSRDLGMPEAQLRAYHCLSESYYRTGQDKLAIKHLNEGAALAQEEGFPFYNAQFSVLSGYIAMNDHQYKKAKSFFLQAQQLLEQQTTYASDSKRLHRLNYQLNNQLALAYRRLNQLDEAIDTYLQAVHDAHQMNDAVKVAGNYSNIGNVYEQLADLNTAVEYHLRAARLADEIDSPLIKAIANNNLGIIYTNLEQYEKALSHLNYALEGGIELNRADIQASVLNNVGEIYEKQNNIDAALMYNERSLALERKLKNDEGIAISLVNIGRLNLRRGDLAAAEEQLQEALTISKDVHHRTAVDSLHSLAQLRLQQQELELATQLLTQAISLAKHYGFNDELKDAYQLASQVAEARGIYQQALAQYKNYEQIKYSIINQKNLDAISRMELQFDSQNKQRQIDRLTQERALSDIKQQKDQAQRTFLLLLIILLILLAMVIFSRYRASSKSRRIIQLKNDELNQVNLKLEKAARTDPLTKLFNRRAFHELAAQEVHRVVRQRRPCAVVLIDIDYFKSINDSYGHDCGDQILVQVADLLRESLRAQDQIARWGGEEFIVLLPETDIRGAYILAEKLRERIEQQRFNCESGELQTVDVTISAGVSEINAAQSDVALSIKQADDALYQSKEKGRNLVTTAAH